MMRFERFTERAQDAAARAYEILQRYGHNQVDTEHILLALLEQTDGVIPQILEKLNVDVSLIRSRLDEVLRASPKAAIYGGGTGQVFITPRVKRIIDLANEEANNLKDEYISTEHIFPGDSQGAQHLGRQDSVGLQYHPRPGLLLDQGCARRPARDRSAVRRSLSHAGEIQP